TAELADNDGWRMLIMLAEKMGMEDMARDFQQALREEDEHLAHIRQWFKESVLKDTIETSDRGKEKTGGEGGHIDKRGFASMDEDKQREIASKGGKAAHEKGTAHEFDSEEAREAGRKGGETVSKDREHMADIGRKGGESVSKDREHMADIGRKGGESVSEDKKHMSEIGRKGGKSSHGGGRHDE
ncbi:KGG domain-containing protein, partial [Nitrosomonas communis]